MKYTGYVEESSVRQKSLERPLSHSPVEERMGLYSVKWHVKCLELMLLNCGVGEDFWNPLDCKEIKPVNPKGNQP